MKNSVYSLLVLLFFSSCSYVAQKTMGIRTPKKMSTAKLQKTADKWNLPAEKIYEIDTNYFYSFLEKQESKSISKLMAKNHMQPLQALYFIDDNPYPSVWYINCYASGFPNLNWNSTGQLDTFPPRQQAPLDSALSHTELLQYIHRIPDQQAAVLSSKPVKIYLILNRFMNRQSKIMIESFQKNAALASDQSEIIYIFNDNAYAGFDISTK